MSPRRLATLLALLVSLGLAGRARAAAPIPPSIVIASVAVSEGNQGLTPFEVSIVYRAGSSPIEADVVAVAGTATGADFQFTPVHLTLVPNVGQTLKGFIVGDTVREPTETFTLHATSQYTFWNQDGAVTIVDDDFVKPPTLTIASFEVPEGNAGWHDVLVPVLLDPPSPDTVTTTFATTGGDPGVFRGNMGVLTFAPGETTKTIPLSVFGNTYWERDKTVTLSLLSAQGAQLETSQGTVTLTNDDAPTVVTIDDATIVEGSSATRTTFVHLHFAPPAPPQSKVWLTIAGVTANEGTDFMGSGFHVLYPMGGETEMTYPIEIVSDTIPECDEGLTIQVQGVYFGDDAVKSARLLITDDDAPKPVGCGDPFADAPVTTDVRTNDAGAAGTGGGNPPLIPPELPEAGTPTTPTPSGAGGAAAPEGATATSGLPERAGCACTAGPGAPRASFGIVVLLGVTLATRRRRARSGR